LSSSLRLALTVSASFGQTALRTPSSSCGLYSLGTRVIVCKQMVGKELYEN
jgi:hypothetical protein